MKRTWISGITVAVVIIVLTLFLGMQYNWLSQASEATRERLHKRVEEDTRRAAEDFNREIQGAYFNFQTDPSRLASGDAFELQDRYSHWSKNTEFPELIRGIFFVEKGASDRIVRFNLESGEFSIEASTAETSPIVQHINSEKHPVSFLESSNALLVPLFPAEKEVGKILIRRVPKSQDEVVEMAKPDGYVVVELDREVIRGKLLPAISARHISTGEFNISAMDRGGQAVYQTAALTGEPDTRAALFDLTPDKLIFFRNREVLPQKEAGTTAVFNQTFESRTLATDKPAQTSNSSQTFTIQVQGGERPRRSVVSAGPDDGAGSWTLQVQHAAGSIDRFVDSERNKSIAIGLGVYFALVAGILAIVISAQRSWNFAQRQIDFVSSVSHEFRTPLAVIYSASENLADGVAKDREQVARYGNLIKGEGKKLSSMVEQILEFAGARSGKRRYSFGPANIADVARKALSDANPLLVEGGFEVNSSIPPELHVQRVDAEALSSAIANLIQNSVKYSNGNRWVRVNVSNGDGSVKIEVEDRGIGISKSDQRRIFEPFFRSKDVVDSQIHGNGLGLSLVKEVAEAHKGSVSVVSEPGEGSKFALTIPQQ